MLNKKWVSGAMMLALALAGTRRASAYIDLAPTFSNILGASPNIMEVEVTAFDRTSDTLSLKVVQTLKGNAPAQSFSFPTAAAGGVPPRAIVMRAVPGAKAVVFMQHAATRDTALICFGQAWYQVNSVGGGAWKIGQERPDLPLAYFGSESRLVEAVKALQKNDGAVITVVAFGADSEGASFDLALNRQALPGVVKLQRLHATVNMPGQVASASSNPTYFIGVGAVDEKDMPALLEKIKTTDGAARAEAIEDLRTLGHKARAATPVLAGLLKDASPRVRFVAASALLRITPKDAAALPVLQAGLSDASPAVRLYAAAAAGYCGAAGGPLTEKLTALLKDPDQGVRLTALESITMLGSAASSAVPALIPLLDDKNVAIDAADALGRIGLAARPAMGKLAELLKSDQPNVRWAAVRGMSQIGGPESGPAVQFMISAMTGATEVEGYNMMVYFIMLGPDGRAAANALQNFRIKNPTLPGVAYWSQNPTQFPWMNGGGGGGRGGRGGGPGGLNVLAYSSAVKELGPRLANLSPMLANAIMDNSAGEIPTWGYELLNAAPEKSLAIFVPHLKDGDLATRERAAVGIGYMGEDGSNAKPAVQAALAKAPTDREKKLLEWTLRQIDTD